MFINVEPIILASGSPRRRQYLADAGLAFSVCSAGIDEGRYPEESVENYVVRMAREKAYAARGDARDSWIVSADTVVSKDERILGKPDNEDQAVAQLMVLAGREHQVRTAFCVANFPRAVIYSAVVLTFVRFWDFSEEAARAYVRCGESFDKAGGYGIQGKGSFLVDSVHGSYSNVVGLPMAELLRVLLRHGVIAPAVKG